MKIKKTVEMKFWELMEYVAENDIKNERFEGILCSDISIVDGSLMTNSRCWFSSKDKYKVEIAEEITENTEFDELKWLYSSSILDNKIVSNGNSNTSINQVIEKFSKDENRDLLSIYSCDKNGILTLLWTKDNGLVLE